MSTSVVPSDVQKLMQRIKAADTDLLAVSEEDGRFLRTLVTSSNATRALEIGGANGYSAIWIGLGLRQTHGHLTSIEYDRHARRRQPRTFARRACRMSSRSYPAMRFRRFPSFRATSTSCSSTRGSATYKRFLDMVFPRLRPGGLFLAHNVVSKKNEMTDFLTAVQTDPRMFTFYRHSVWRRHVGNGEGTLSHATGCSHHRRAARSRRRTTKVWIWGRPRFASRVSVSVARRTRMRGHRHRQHHRSAAGDAGLTSPTQAIHRRHRQRVPELYVRSRRALDGNAVPMVLGGDHSLGAGSVAAAASWAQHTASQPIGLIWVDAHGDMNTRYIASGNVHGMPLAALLGPRTAGAVDARRGAAGGSRGTRCCSASVIWTTARRLCASLASTSSR